MWQLLANSGCKFLSAIDWKKKLHRAISALYAGGKKNVYIIVPFLLFQVSRALSRSSSACNFSRFIYIHFVVEEQQQDFQCQLENKRSYIS